MLGCVCVVWHREGDALYYAVLRYNGITHARGGSVHCWVLTRAYSLHMQVMQVRTLREWLVVGSIRPVEAQGPRLLKEGLFCKTVHVL